MNDTKPAMPELPKPTKWYMPEHDQVEYTADQMRAYGAACADAARAVPQWLPIESAPKDGYFLVYEDGAIRAKFRFNGDWSSVEYPYIEIDPWKDRLVGADALRLLGPGKRLGISDECQEPTHWMPHPAAPGAQPAPSPAQAPCVGDQSALDRDKALVKSSDRLLDELKGGLDESAQAPALCECKDRAASECPGTWEPGCDMGANEKFVQVSAQAPAERPARSVRA